MNNIFLSLGQMNPDTRSDAVVELLTGQVRRGVGALERHLGEGKCAAGDTLTRADCTLVPSLWMCTGTIPRLGVEDPVASTEKVAAYWSKIQKNPTHCFLKRFSEVVMTCT